MTIDSAPSTTDPSAATDSKQSKETFELIQLAHLLDSQFKIPFTSIRIGWDFIIGLVPVAGNLLTTLVSIYIVITARHYRVSRLVWLKMILNILIDTLLGIIPIAGNVADAFWRSNDKNIKLLKEAIEKQKHAS